jgi:predicted anti-sigma-YlaC factor YlaD
MSAAFPAIAPVLAVIATELPAIAPVFVVMAVVFAEMVTELLAAELESVDIAEVLAAMLWRSSRLRMYFQQYLLCLSKSQTYSPK